ncbi:transcobalamin-1-like isoform X1 [Astyanax mexicanus]|uniref:Transcobalamin-1-like isoform X1 n=1 Tax=Astyanax mexicanus TaxID=7994 RepID=A0A8T2L0E4_ASTMX|nr:transcobalamin-1-like isoform X1 [Astyanax mexicanus]
MALATALLLSAAALILVPGVFTEEKVTLYPITMTVYDAVTNKPNATYATSLPYRAVLLGAMRRAQKNFRFITKENSDYGPFLDSINGMKGITAKRTYWQLLIQPKNGTLIVADVGVGCYIPNPEDHIIFKFTKW